MAIRKPLIIGMGHVGSLIALLLTEAGMQVAGVDREASPSIPAHVAFTSADITDPHTLAALCRGRDVVIACPILCSLASLRECIASA
jgi:nucleoside-diphosphate-sugar epimerase